MRKRPSSAEQRQAGAGKFHTLVERGHQRRRDHGAYAERGDGRHLRRVVTVDDKDVDESLILPRNRERADLELKLSEDFGSRALDRAAGDDRRERERGGSAKLWRSSLSRGSGQC